MARRTILVKGDGIFKEAVTAGVITPGHLILMGSAGTITAHSAAAGNVGSVAFAVENENVGKDIDTNWASGDLCEYVVPQRGSEINALLAANAAAIVIGDLLESAGDGTLRKYTAPSQAVNEGGAATYTIAPKVRAVVAVAREAVNNSANGTTARILVEVL